MRLTLNSLENSRKSISRILRLYWKGEMEADHFRNMMYGFSILHSYWKTEKELEIENRIEAIEKQLEKKR